MNLFKQPDQELLELTQQLSQEIKLVYQSLKIVLERVIYIEDFGKDTAFKLFLANQSSKIRGTI